MLLIHLVQLFASLLWPIEALRPARDRIITFTKAQYGLLCVFLSQCFAPTRIVLTADEGVEGLVDVDVTGRTKLRLPARNGACILVALNSAE
jgi:hypothetical protein